MKCKRIPTLSNTASTPPTPNSTTPTPVVDHPFPQVLTTNIDPAPTTIERGEPTPTIVEEPQSTIETPLTASPVLATVPLGATLTAAPAVRSRGMSIGQYDVDADDGDESSDDSVLSFWSSDEEESDTEQDTPDTEAEKRDSEEREHKDTERKRREAERQKALAAAGLKIRREPPGIPSRGGKPKGRRRPAPAVPIRRPAAETTAPSQTEASPLSPRFDQGEQSEIKVQDAYARYEQFLAESRARPVGPRRHSTAASPGPNLATLLPPTPGPSPSPSLMSAGKAGFSGFLSRMGVTQHMDRPASSKLNISRPISSPLISGPVSGGPTDSPAESPMPDNFGSTWSSLVDQSVLSTMDPQERKRQESIFEFIGTESTYVRDLQLIVGVFYAKLMTILDERALTVIFANVEDILMFNSFFLSALEDRQKACRLYVDVIGDILAEHCQNFGVYMPYCVNQDTARKMLVQLRKSMPELEAALQDIKLNNPSVRGLDLSSFLLEPMQRITRYPLLLRQIAKYTTPDQDLDNVQRALTDAENTVARINEDVRESESSERLRVLSEDLWVGGEG